MIKARPSEFMNDFTKLLTAENTVKRYKTGRLTPAEQMHIEEKTKELYTPEFKAEILKNFNNAIDNIFTEMHKAQEDGSQWH